MTNNEILTLAISGLSLVMASIALIVSTRASHRANEIGSERLLVAHAALEIDIAQQINDSRVRREDFPQPAKPSGGHPFTRFASLTRELAIGSTS